MKTQQLEIKLSNKTEEDIKKARRKSTQAGECRELLPTCPHLGKGAQQGEGWGMRYQEGTAPMVRLAGGAVERRAG